jgi:hypothetical protein|tara:strand:- start:140 stop:274 length:135 start_codon:yes stop_codon:yes gene_type:complete
MNKIIEDAAKENIWITIALLVMFGIAILYMFDQFMTAGPLYYPR